MRQPPLSTILSSTILNQCCNRKSTNYERNKILDDQEMKFLCWFYLNAMLLFVSSLFLSFIYHWFMIIHIQISTYSLNYHVSANRFLDKINCCAINTEWYTSLFFCSFLLFFSLLFFYELRKLSTHSAIYNNSFFLICFLLLLISVNCFHTFSIFF